MVGWTERSENMAHRKAATSSIWVLLYSKPWQRMHNLAIIIIKSENLLTLFRCINKNKPKSNRCCIIPFELRQFSCIVVVVVVVVIVIWSYRRSQTAASNTAQRQTQKHNNISSIMHVISWEQLENNPSASVSAATLFKMNLIRNVHILFSTQMHHIANIIHLTV